MTEKKWNELDLEGKAKEISSLIEESLPLPWHNSNPYDLKTAMTKPLEDERVDSFEKIIKRLPLPSNVSFPFKEINRSMVKIKAMPLLRKEYINTYVFNTNEMFDSDWIRDYERDLCGETCLQYEINKSYDMAKHFLEMAIKVSKECTFQYDKTYDEKQIIKKSRFFIVGEPGVGKTTFLNYLISVFGESIIESSNSILLRIDLNDAVSKNANFEKFILERFGEIYYSYFFRNGKFVFDENKLLDHFLKVRNISNRDNKKINYIKQSINKFRNGESSSLPFLKELLIFLTIEQKISYIFVFDGLDYITLDEIHTNKFDKWLQQIDNYILSSRALRGTYILTMRDVSFQKALQAKSGSTLEFWREPKKLKIIRVDLESIIDRRLDHIRKNIKEKINKWLSDKKYQYDVNRWIEQIGVKNLLDEYVAYVSLAFIDNPVEKIKSIKSHADLKSVILKEGYKILDDISCGNYRCLMRNLNIITGYFENIFTKDIDHFVNNINLQERLDIYLRRSYHVVRSFIVGRVEMSDYRTPYTYLSENGKKNKIIIKKIGTRFTIPPITNFVDKYRIGIDKIHFRGLFKIRVLQFLTLQRYLMFFENFTHASFSM